MIIDLSFLLMPIPLWTVLLIVLALVGMIVIVTPTANHYR